uniref:Uncharacterized protein n=1 Tax=Aegilops tauschii TaxID=37682 RepID=M8CAX6_AEGTA
MGGKKFTLAAALWHTGQCSEGKGEVQWWDGLQASAGSCSSRCEEEGGGLGWQASSAGLGTSSEEVELSVQIDWKLNDLSQTRDDLMGELGVKNSSEEAEWINVAVSESVQ